MIEELWKEYNEKRGSEERDKLIMACLPYVKLSANRLAMYANPSQDVDDLISAGIIGLMDAIEKYDPSKGASFKVYAQYRIRGAIMDEIRSMDWVPSSVREKAKRIEKIYLRLEQNKNKTPDEEEIADALGVSLDEYYQMLLDVNRMTISLLDDIFYDNNDIYTDLEDASAKNPPDELALTEMEKLLGEAIERLPEKERLVVTLYYYEEMTMKEIGQVINISESRVCQIHSSAILRLHAKLKMVGESVRTS